MRPPRGALPRRTPTRTAPAQPPCPAPIRPSTWSRTLPLASRRALTDGFVASAPRAGEAAGLRRRRAAARRGLGDADDRRLGRHALVVEQEHVVDAGGRDVRRRRRVDLELARRTAGSVSSCQRWSMLKLWVTAPMRTRLDLGDARGVGRRRRRPCRRTPCVDGAPAMAGRGPLKRYGGEKISAVVSSVIVRAVEPAAAGEQDAAVGQQQRRVVVAARADAGGHRRPRVGLRMPDLGLQDGAVGQRVGVREALAAEREHVAVGQHGQRVERPRPLHRRDLAPRRHGLGRGRAPRRGCRPARRPGSRCRSRCRS